MYKIVLDPSNILPSGGSWTTEELVRIAGERRLGSLGSLAGFEMPLENRDIAKYVIFDGHHRRAAAVVAKSPVELMVLEEANDFRYVPGYNYPYYYEKSQEGFDYFKSMIVHCALHTLKYDKISVKN